MKLLVALGIIYRARCSSIRLDEMHESIIQKAFSDRILKTEGVFVISDAVRTDLLESLATALTDCLGKTDSESIDVHESRILDGSKRATFANFAGANFGQCGAATQELVAEYSERISYVGRRVGRFVAELIEREFGVSSQPLDEMVLQDDGASLDHYHIYSEFDVGRSMHSLVPEKVHPEDHINEALESVPMHVDMGLFLLLSPGIWIGDGDSNSEAPGLVVRTKDGSVISLPPSGINDSGMSPLIVVLGAGLSQWLFPGLGIRAGVHAVSDFSNAKISGLQRVMLGRMYLPSPDTVSPGGVPFDRFFESPMKFDHSALPASSAQWRRLIEERCEAGTKYCWMDCMPDVDCGVGVESVCKDPTTEQVCLESECNANCQLMCPVVQETLVPDTPPSQPIRAAANPPPFCRGGTSMVMSGFESVTTENANCIILFFRPWLLNSASKFAFGCIGVFLLGLLIEAVIRLRRFIGGQESIRGSRRIKEGVVVALFAVNVTLGYLGMLAAMTFNVEIFVSIVAGLATGHVLFANAKAPVRETADPCCVTTELPNQLTTSLRNSTGACCCEPGVASRI